MLLFQSREVKDDLAIVGIYLESADQLKRR
jgi:hypothetical protein